MNENEIHMFNCIVWNQRKNENYSEHASNWVLCGMNTFYAVTIELFPITIISLEIQILRNDDFFMSSK